MSHVVLLSTGGTIASRATAEGGSGVVDSGASLLARVESQRGHEVEVHDVLSVNSFNLDLGDMRTLQRAVRTQLNRSEVAGVVITHGTDTLEETAALLAAVHSDDRPVVLTGAQRGSDVPDTDGPRNLGEAIRVAGASSSRGRGVLVSFAGEIHAALGVRKVHTIAPRPFASTLGGPVGVIEDGEPEFWLMPPRSLGIADPAPDFDDTRVDIIAAYPGADGTLIEAALDAGARGLVILAPGAGNPGLRITEAIRAAVERGVLVGLSSRTGGGPVRALYGGGGAIDAIGAGALPLGAVPPTQARVLMALLLSQATVPEAGRRLRRILRTERIAAPTPTTPSQ